MLKSITCAAMALASLCAFAQSDTWMNKHMSKDGIYYSDSDLLANPPSATKNTVSYGDMRWNVMHQADWLNGADRYNLYSMLEIAPGDVSNSLLQALYNLRSETYLARHDLVAQAVAQDEQMAMSPAPGYTYFFAQSTPSNMSQSTTGMMAQNGMSDFTDVGNRPMRMVLDQAKVPNITYEDAADIIEHELNAGAATAFDAWFWGSDSTTNGEGYGENRASDQDRDVLVRMLKMDAWIKNQPIYASTLTRGSF